MPTNEPVRYELIRRWAGLGWDEDQDPLGILTVGFHQLNLHGVGDQGLGQLGEETLHGTGHGVDSEILLGQVQPVICKGRVLGLHPQVCGCTPKCFRGAGS